MQPFEERLAEASATWVEAGLISAETRQAILARHPVAGAGPSRGLAIMAAVGGALVLVGVSLFIKANWQDLGDWVKLTGLVALMVGSYAAGWRLKIAPGHFPKTGEVCFVAGTVLFLLGIALVSQIFHLESRPANGVLVGCLGIAAVPWLVRSRGAQVVSLATGLTWITLELAAADSWLRLAAGDDRWYRESVNHFAAAGGLLGLALLASGLGLRTLRENGFAGLHEKLGLLLVAGSLYVLGFSWAGERWWLHVMTPARWQPVAVLVGLAAVALVWAWRRNPADSRGVMGWLLPAVVPMGARLAGIELGDSGWLWGGLACALLFVANVGMIRHGLATGREDWIAFGIVGIGLNVLTRYFILFGSMLEGGLFFTVTGVLVLVVGYALERKRRALVGELARRARS